MKTIQIDQVNLRLHGVSPQKARSALAGLDGQVQRAFSEQAPEFNTDAKIAALTPPPVRIQANVSADQLRRQIANAIHGSMMRRS